MYEDNSKFCDYGCPFFSKPEKYDPECLLFGVDLELAEKTNSNNDYLRCSECTEIKSG